MSGKWTPEQFWEFMKGYTGEFEAGQIRDMLDDSGLILAVAPSAQEPGAAVLLAALRDCTCPRPMNSEPDDLTIGQCFDKKQCGCQNGLALTVSAMAQSTARTVDLRSTSVLLDSLDRIAESFKDVEPCRHNNDNLISDLKIELAGLRGALSPAMMESGWQDARAHINARLEDLATANALYGKDNRLSAPEKIERNNREISWLKDLRSILGLSVAPVSAPNLAEIQHEARFLLDRLEELDDANDDEYVREFEGHVRPSMSRLGRLVPRNEHAPPPPDTDPHGDGHCGCTERCKDRDNCEYDGPRHDRGRKKS
ncbi:hypothetical protein [Tardiphaga sp. 841_E9_N1_2]|uniref:hypothetical protein n=1 Tax=Tardiphaga sp. 841_E9_N1_2 TaxID=3240762 RepID=UPI003F253D9B